MIFTETHLKDAFIIDLDRHEDERGFFARSWCQQEFETQKLNSKLVQCNISFNKKSGTVRGMHYQINPYQETKVVRCTMGAIHDVIIDLRPDSVSYKRWLAVHLSAENRCGLYIPAGFAHGFQTLTDNTEVFYQMSEYYHPDAARGLRWNDPAFEIEWPLEISVISEKDQSYSAWVEE